MLVLGDKELEADTVNIRKYGESQSESQALQTFVDMIKAEARK